VAALNHPALSLATATLFNVALDGTRLTASWTGESRFAPGETVRALYHRTPFVRVQPETPRATREWTWVQVGLGGLQALSVGALLLLGAMLRLRKLRRSAA
jgi:hypothetical protein